MAEKPDRVEQLLSEIRDLAKRGEDRRVASLESTLKEILLALQEWMERAEGSSPSGESGAGLKDILAAHGKMMSEALGKLKISAPDVHVTAKISDVPMPPIQTGLPIGASLSISRPAVYGMPAVTYTVTRES